MSWLGRVLGRRPAISQLQCDRLAQWRRQRAPDHDSPLREQRFVVVDVETSGLDVQSDRLLAIGAVAVAGGQICLDQSFYRVLRQRNSSDSANILVHGITGSEQLGGDDPVEVLLGFLEFAGKCLFVGYHAQFDEIMIRKAMKSHLGDGSRRQWLDLAYLGPALERDRNLRLGARTVERGLDGWLSTCGIVNYSRHHALADAIATAQLFLVFAHRAAAAAGGSLRVREIREMADSQKWLSRQPR